MEVHLPAEKEAQLAEIAAAQGRNAAALAQEILGNYLEADAKFIEAVKLGEAALREGKYFTHEEIGKRFERLMQS